MDVSSVKTATRATALSDVFNVKRLLRLGLRLSLQLLYACKHWHSRSLCVRARSPNSRVPRIIGTSGKGLKLMGIPIGQRVLKET